MGQAKQTHVTLKKQKYGSSKTNTRLQLKTKNMIQAKQKHGYT
jgi:hypothetical protein